MFYHGEEVGCFPIIDLDDGYLSQGRTYQACQGEDQDEGDGKK